MFFSCSWCQGLAAAYDCDTPWTFLHIMGYFLAPDGSVFQNLFIVTAAGVTCRVVAIKVLSILHHSAEYIF